jgi:hypothetical protein
MATDERWKHDGVRVIPGTELDPNTPQTPESVVVNLDIEPVEKPENVKWIDPIHRG